MNSKPYVLGIAGSSGSGKTFFLNCFLKHFNEDEICLVSQDDYYIPVGKLSDEDNKLYNFDLPSTIDNDQFLKDINNLLSGQTVYKKEYLFNNPTAEPQILEIKPAPVIIVEGLFILHFEQISGLLDYTIFINTDEEVALQRRLKRDLHERGYPEDSIRYKWINHVVPAYKEFLLPYKDKCDKEITNNTQVEEDIISISEEISKELRLKL
ncbi:MAG TPA: P-loop NTPase fold protein [Sphingobacteriaceae bacterium]|nr:P-loop NTPase fold protein [Sphingobacteriaceae bacterium]